jgi:hypothetical protein
LAAVCGTQILATVIAVYGVGLVTPLGWKYAGIVWGYAFAWFLVTDPVKLLAYKVLDTGKTAPKHEARPEPAGKAEAKPDAKAAPQPKTEAEPKPDAKAEPKPEAKAQAKPDPDPNPKEEPELTAKAAPKSDTKEAAKLDAKAASQPEATTESKPETEPKPRTNAGIATLLTTSLGDLLVAGLVKDPADAGRVIAAGITETAANIAAAKAPANDAVPKTDAKAAPKPEAKVETPPDVKPLAAE